MILLVPRDRKGDYYRYLAEFKAGDDRKEVADQSLKAYEVFNFHAGGPFLYHVFTFLFFFSSSFSILLYSDIKNEIVMKLTYAR